MADFYRITSFVSKEDFATKLNQAALDLGFTSTITNSNEVNIVMPVANALGDYIRFYIDATNNGYCQILDVNGSSPSLFADAGYMRLDVGISDIHIFGWESPRALFVGFRRTDNVWIQFYVGAMERIGGNPQGYCVSYSHQIADGESYDGNSASTFPTITPYDSPYVSPLFGTHTERGRWTSAI